MVDKRYPEKIAHLNKPLQILIKTFVQRLDSGKNCLVAIVGGTGSGKSFASVTILYWTYVYMNGKEPDLEFMKKRWFFKSKDFLERMNDKTLKKKDLNLWDEMGVSASHKSHSSIQNRAIGFLVQTFRNLEQLVIFTVPTLNYVDKTVRNLLHYQLETRTILKTTNTCIIKPLEIQYNIRMDKVYYHNLHWKAEDGSGYIDEVDVVGVPLPPPEFAKAYETKSWEFKAELNKRIQAMVESANEKERKQSLTGVEAIEANLTPKQKFIWEEIKKGYHQQKDVSERTGSSSALVSATVKSLILKGLNVQKYKLPEPSKQKIQKIDAPTNFTFYDSEKKIENPAL